METGEGKQAFKKEKFLFNDIIHHLIFLIRRSSLMGLFRLSISKRTILA